MPLHNPSEFASGAVRDVRSRSRICASLVSFMRGVGGRTPLARVHHGRMAPPLGRGEGNLYASGESGRV